MTTRKSDPSWVLNIPAIREAMVRAKLKPYNLQLLANVDHSAMYRMLDGTIRNPSSATLMNIASVLDVDPRDLMTRQW